MTKEATNKTRKTAPKPANRRAGETAAAAPAPPKPASNRAERAAERRAAIIAAAMDEFIARGFAATRLDDIAKRAGVAKGTIYLHFKDKESMFEELIRTAIVPMISRLWGTPPQPGASVRDMVEGFAQNLHRGGGDHAARRPGAADRRRGSAISGDGRLLLPRGGVARPRRHARADRTRHRARRNQQQGTGAVPADHGGAGADRRDLAEPVSADMRRWTPSKCFGCISI